MGEHTIHPPSAALIVAPRLKSIPIAIRQYWRQTISRARTRSSEEEGHDTATA